MDRRDFIKTTTAAAALTGARTLKSAPSSKRQPDLIKTENAKAGASFQLTRMMPDNAKSYRTSLIEGYCSRQSVKAGRSSTSLSARSRQPSSPSTSSAWATTTACRLAFDDHAWPF
jgi:hypothetical protein